MQESERAEAILKEMHRELRDEMSKPNGSGVNARIRFALHSAEMRAIAHELDLGSSPDDILEALAYGIASLTVSLTIKTGRGDRKETSETILREISKVVADAFENPRETIFHIKNFPRDAEGPA